ncbi:MAG TPA: hypothetical protein VK440_05940, partial [Burkholderiales bacterium]|nr:hypothetical protein [Burkholderiales bacterium]
RSRPVTQQGHDVRLVPDYDVQPLRCFPPTLLRVFPLNRYAVMLLPSARLISMSIQDRQTEFNPAHNSTTSACGAVCYR